ncbi:UDP-N-acetylenolpyruvoylglucosamine reductase [Fundidesulfovibrio magnetotacticus]|uniref:UDP-N-acetylenolpyruvoylglucosamine reductase n=1 Tax=Fundidesulfovibrio magnetotacticus TaxID=2730080 RepID=A0A6V8LTW3_9BACT|nr:UDP-N-acetylmuramate dehydrogenase [Fundidesulfovibrio magnetotacticus]GFK93549.1 UDP-N-acetylenolpyruvoylglucosamine reductase [Fundidesulfovibrio magnetotacticus]
MALRLLPGPRFAERTTLRLGGRAAAELAMARPEDWEGLEQALAGSGGRPLALGWGSNLLAHDQDLDLCVVTLPEGEPLAVGQDEDGRVRVRAWGGLMLPRLVNWAAREGYSGLEPLAGIPGTVGGAVAMNAGSYGSETAALLARVLVWDAARGARWIEPGGWRAGYRAFWPEGLDQGAFWLALAAELSLAPARAQDVRLATDATLARKKASQPVSAATCGCVFKNPEGESAGRMLDELGFKGKSLGGMCFSPMHANFLVNEGRGSATAALELINRARASVWERFGVELELEVKVLA